MIFDTTEHFHMMDGWITALGPFWWIFMALGWVLLIVSGIVIGYKVHKDAVRRGIINSEIWLIIGLVFNVIGLLLYLLVRNNYNQIRQVPKKE